FDTRPGEIPRRILIERKKRLFSQQKIENLLMERGIDHTKPLKSALAYLNESIPPIPVEVFDNDDFEVRSPDNWLRLGQDSQGQMAGLPARALYMFPSGSGQWRECKV
ncbi:unnamed protein product, partial [Choristocarpus tenellus]